jgi:hypothetical protein
MSSWNIRVLLFALFGAAAVLMCGQALKGAADALWAVRENQRVEALALANKLVFVALQNARLERGPTRTALEAKDPAAASLLSQWANLRSIYDPAVADVVAT